MELAYQPIVNLQTGLVTKVEALLRLGASQESVSEYVTFCECSGRIKNLTTDILAIGLSDWQRHGRPGVGISINLSIANLDEPDFAKRVDKALKQHRFDPTELWFELAERAQEMIQPQRVACMRSVASVGIRFSLDSFFDVTQFTVEDLRRLPWSELKIQGELVAAAVEIMAKRYQLKAALAVAHQLGIDVTAKGIENADVAELMKRLGCTHGQGHYFASPTPVKTIGAVLDAMRAAASMPQPA